MSKTLRAAIGKKVIVITADENSQYCHNFAAGTVATIVRKCEKKAFKRDWELEGPVNWSKTPIIQILRRDEFVVQPD